MDDELDAFVAMLTDEHIARGLTPEAARRAALLEAGGVEQVKEAIRDGRPRRLFDQLRQDLRYGVRLCRRAPGLNAGIVLALALGIGATSATFSVVDAVLVQPLGYRDAGALVAVLHRRTQPVAPANFLDWQRESTAFSAMGAAEYWTPTLGVGADPQKLIALHVSDELLPLLGVPPAAGRLPRAGEAGVREVVIADGLWRRVFGADPSVIGRPIALDGVEYTVAGVMPPGFRFAPFWATRAELWAPLALGARASDRGGSSLRVFARLAPGVSLDQARTSMAALTAAMEAQHPGTNRFVTVTPLKELVVGDARRSILVLFAAVGLVLLVACANVTHLLLSRALSRQKEVAVRIALGAGRARLVRQVLTESLLLAAVGCAGGVLLAAWMIEVIQALGADSIPRVESIRLDARVLVFATLVSGVTAMLSGLAPAIQLARPAVSGALREHERGTTTGRRSRRLRQVLIASEVALAVTLLIGAGLLVRSFMTLRAIEPGFVSERLLTFVVSVTGTPEGAPGRSLPFYLALRDRIARLPGVAAVSAINHAPLVGDIWGFPYRIEGGPEPAPGDRPTAAYRVVLPRYFETMGLPLVSGRDFTDADRAGAAPVVIISQHLAETRFPGGHALGARMRVGGETAWRTVVGVASHVVRSDWQDRPGDEVYLPVPQVARFRDDPSPASGYLTFVVRGTGDPGSLVPSLRAAVRAGSPTAPVSDLFLMTDVVRDATRGAQFMLVLLGAFATIAWLLAAIGIYGVMSHHVSMRRQELGIRLALGASRARIAAAVIGEGMAVAGAGIVAGAATAWVLGGALSGMLVGITATDVPAFAGAIGALAVAAFVACGVPARRAGAIDPQRELR